MRKPPPELVIIEKTQELLVWTLKHIAKFPRSHRYGLGLRLEQRLSSLLDRFIEAKFTRERLPLLQRCNPDPKRQSGSELNSFLRSHRSLTTQCRPT